MEKSSQHLIVVVDALQEHWEVQQNSFINANSQSLTLPMVASAIKAFGNALRLQNSDNSLKVYVAMGSCSEISLPDGFRLINGSVWKGAAQALCYINTQQAKHRVLIIQKAVDEGEQEMALSLMIAAQQIKVQVDGLAFSDCEVLAKTSAFTGGVFMRQSSAGILQTLLQVYLPVHRPKAPPMDFKPFCYCCRKLVDRAYVCSACLTVYCTMNHCCSVCAERLILPDSI
jgi:hypothetical protein